MRLTLRTLLAYLDDTLSPQQTREIGLKVAENPTARELIARIRQVTRRRRLTTPEMSGSAETNVDPNVVAEYLDNELPPEKVEELEKLCLESDVNLAEVAACHQILTVILGQPAKVPPTAYQRMYGLVQGPEAIPTRRPPVAAAPSEAAYEDRGEDGDEALLLGLPAYQRSAPWVRRLMPVAVALLLALGLIAIVAVGMRSEPRPGESIEVARSTVPAKPSEVPAEPRPAEKPGPGEAAAPPPTEPVSPPPDPLGVWAGWVPMWTGWVAIRPEMPLGFFLLFGHEEAVVGDAEPKPQEPVVERVVRPPSLRPLPLGRLALPRDRESPPAVLLRQLAADDIRYVRPEARVQGGEPLMALPGFRAEIDLDKQMRLSLVGTLPSQIENLFYECVVVLHENPDFDVDLTLDRGRIVLFNRPAGDGKVRLRFLDQVWDLRLKQPEVRVGFELHGRVQRGSGPWIPHYKVALLVDGGEVELVRETQVEKLASGQVFLWDQPSVGREPGLIVEFKDTPFWLKDFRANYPNEVRNALTAFVDRLQRKLPQIADEKSPWVVITCEESLQESANWPRWIGLFSLGALDQLRLVVRALEETERHDMRFVALDVLRAWVGRKPDQHLPLRAALEQRSYSPQDADLFLQYLRGYDQVTPEIVRQLVDSLDHDRLIIRELALINLNLIVPPDRLQEFRNLPIQPPEMRRRAIETLRNRLLPRP